MPASVHTANREQIIDRLKLENLRLVKEKEDLLAQDLLEVTEFQTKTHQSLDACKLILTQISDSQSSHWQKKENICLAIEVLKKFKIASCGFVPFAWEDDY